MQQFYPVSGEASTIANAIATAISKNLTIEQQNIVGNLFALIGASMLSIAAINESLSKPAEGPSQNHTNHTKSG